MRSNIAVIGDKESVLGFKAVGFRVFERTVPQRAEALIERLAKEGYGVIFITEQLLEPIQQVLNAYKDRMVPAIIPIPGRAGSLGLGMAGVRSSVERAVGADILFKE